MFQSKTSQDKKDTDLRMIPAVGWPQGGRRSVFGLVIKMSTARVWQVDFSCPPPASLTATQQTTVSPPSWLITKQLAVSARAVMWHTIILDCSTCLTCHVKLVIFPTWILTEDCVPKGPRSYWETRRTVFTRSTVRNTAYSKPHAIWYDRCVIARLIRTFTRHRLIEELVSLYNGVNQSICPMKMLRMWDWYL